MAWYDIPKLKAKYIYDENGKVVGVLLNPSDFEKLVEKMEDFLDHAAIEREKKQPLKKLYTHEEIKAIVEGKKR